MKGSLKKKSLVVLIIGAIGFSMLAILWFQAQSEVAIDGTDLEWNISEDDEFSVFVNITGSQSSWYGENTYSTFNWSSDSVIIRILELPEIPSTVDTNTIIFDIIRPMKIQCISNEISQNYSSILTSLLSKLVLPTGSWDSIDSMFDDSLPVSGGYPTLSDLEFDTDYFAGKISEGCFYFGIRRFASRFPNWETESWYGLINLETGIPITANYRDSKPDCTASYSLSMYVEFNP